MRFSRLLDEVAKEIDRPMTAWLEVENVETLIDIPPTTGCLGWLGWTMPLRRVAESHVPCISILGNPVNRSFQRLCCERRKSILYCLCMSALLHDCNPLQSLLTEPFNSNK